MAFLVLGCRKNEKDPLEGFSGEVCCQRPKVSLRSKEPVGKDSLLAARVQSFFAKRPAVFDSLASACQSSAREAGEGWTMMGCFEDGSGNLHLVYFNRYRHHRILAGRKLHLCFDRQRKLDNIYIYQVPLE